jgi:hypothetical protein
VQVTRAGIIINHLEPQALWAGIIMYSDRALPRPLHAWMLLFTALSLAYSMGVADVSCTTVTPESAPHLYWKWNEGPYRYHYYIVFLFTLLLLSYHGLRCGGVQAVMIFLGYAISYVVYADTHSVGSMWCFAAG